MTAFSVAPSQSNRHPNDFHHGLLAKYLNNHYSAMETVECEELLEWADKMQQSKEPKRTSVVVEFAEKFLARLPSGVLPKMVTDIANGKNPRPKKADRARVAACLTEVARSNDLLAVDRCLGAIESLDERPVFASREIWKDMRRTLQQHGASTKSLRQTARAIRDQGRRVGRRVPKRCLGTVLLVKGLEFDHAVVLNAAELDDAESLYVALTRGSSSLTVLSEQSIIRRNPPRFKTNFGTPSLGNQLAT